MQIIQDKSTLDDLSSQLAQKNNEFAKVQIQKRDQEQFLEEMQQELYAKQAQLSDILELHQNDEYENLKLSKKVEQQARTIEDLEVKLKKIEHWQSQVTIPPFNLN